MRAGQGKISLLSKTVVSSSSHLPFNSPTQKARITTHAVYKRAIPTERNANTNYLYSREHRAFSYLREKGSTYSNENLNRSWTRIFRKYSYPRKTRFTNFTSIRPNLRTRFEVYKRRTNPSLNRVASRDVARGCPLSLGAHFSHDLSLSLFLFLYPHFSLFLFLSLPLVARLPFFSSFNSIFFFSF